MVARAGAGGWTRSPLRDAYALAMASFERVAVADREVARTRLSPYRALTTVAPSVALGGRIPREKDEIVFDGRCLRPSVGRWSCFPVSRRGVSCGWSSLF